MRFNIFYALVVGLGGVTIAYHLALIGMYIFAVPIFLVGLLALAGCKAMYDDYIIEKSKGHYKRDERGFVRTFFDL